MNAERLLRNYEKIADTPDAIPRLRRFILELAVRGKLVPQDPDDEPALCGTRATSHHLNIPFAIPTNWRWAEMQDLGKIKGGGTPSKARADYWEGDIPWVSPKDMKVDYINDAQLKISQTAVEESSTQIIKLGSILFVVRGMILAHSFPVAISQVCVAINQDMKALELADASMGEYLLRAFKGMKSEVLKRVQRSSHGTCRLESRDYALLPIPLPPLAEQRRIVSKVDELMGLCDELESRREEREGYRDGLVRSSYGRLNETEGNDFRAAASFAIKTLGSLTARSNQIKHLRQTILNLAVRGKLVPQDPTDEPASQVLNRIAVAPKIASRTRKTKDEGDGVPAEINCLYKPPSGWKWTPFWKLFQHASVGVDRGRSMQGPDKPFGYFKMSNIKNSGGIDLFDIARIDATPVEVEVYALIDGDFLFNTRNSRELVGKTCVFRSSSATKILYNNNILRIKFIEGILPDFIDYWFRSEVGSVELEKLKSSTTNVCAIYQGKLLGFPCVIPPLAEQHRIVAKVNELNALCDELESSLTTTDTTRKQLLESLLSESLSNND